MAHEPTAGGIGELPPVVGPPVERPRKPRLPILFAGGWTALCWLLLVLSVVTTDVGGVVLAVVGMLPVSFVWRYRYWRRGEGARVWVAGFVYPMRDALRELRAGRGGGPLAS